jgi:hypothetical protein
MVRVSIVVGGALMLGSGATLAGTPCEELKSEIAAKLDAKGINHDSLDVVATDQVGDQKVIGSVGGGTKKIVCKRT